MWISHHRETIPSDRGILRSSDILWSSPVPGMASYASGDERLAQSKMTRGQSMNDVGLGLVNGKSFRDLGGGRDVKLSRCQYGFFNHAQRRIQLGINSSWGHLAIVEINVVNA